MIIEVKSYPENFNKEKAIAPGIKPNTVRRLDGKDIIRIKNTDTGEIIERPLTDITTWKGDVIFSYSCTPCKSCSQRFAIDSEGLCAECKDNSSG